MGSSAAAASGEGIAIGNPVLLRIGDKNLPAVLVTNTSAQPRSFSLTVTWKAGDVQTTARGAVFGLRPRELRAVNLATDTTIAIDAMVTEARVDRILPVDQRQVDVEERIRFGTPKVQQGSLSAVEVPVTNADSVPHGVTLGAALLQKTTLIGTAAGTLPNIGPQLTLPVSLTIAGADSGYDQILVYVTGVSS